MPLIFDGGRIPPRWAANSMRTSSSLANAVTQTQCVRIAIVNNMPDSALEDTEMQFFELLEAAAGDVTVRLKLHCLRGVPREDRGQQHLDNFYFSTDDLLKSCCDAMIITGTEPRQSDLRNEPYWSSLTEVLDWAEGNTASTILSCLAAHAGVLYSDGIGRHRLSDKQFGIFDFARTGVHQLNSSIGDQIRFPHSRWNEVRSNELTACGYTVLTKSIDSGVDTFVKRKKQSLFVHFQGHPEYSAHTLLKEYRRDIRRFLKSERETYPSMPQGYFSARAEEFVLKFRDAVLSGHRREELILDFPDDSVLGGLQKTWHASAVGVYRNWLAYIAARMAEVPVFSAMAAVYPPTTRKRSALP